MTSPRYTLLLETRSTRQAGAADPNPGGDVYLASYIQGRRPQEDQVGWPFPVAISDADERAPSWDQEGRAWYLSGDALYRTRPGTRPGIRPGRRRPERVVELEGLEDYLILEPPQGGGPVAVLHAVRTRQGRLSSELWRLRLAGRSLERLPDHGLHPTALLPGLDPDSVSLTTHDGLYRIPLDAGPARLVARGPFQEASLSRDRRRLVYLLHERGRPSQVRWRELGTGADRQVASQPPGGYLHSPSFSPDGSRVFFTVHRPALGASHEAWVVESAGGAATRLDLSGHFHPARIVAHAA